jgi:2'-5' RNA ligase
VAQVTAVVCAAFDADTDVAIYAVRELVRDAGITLPPLPPHRPHFSLAAARVTREQLPRVLAVAAAVAADHGPIPVRLEEVGRFGRAGAVWLGPGHSPHLAQLARLQRDTAAALNGAGWTAAFGVRSDPEQWVPHCTLATRVPKPRLREVQAEVRRRYQPIDGMVDALATILVGGRGDVGLVPLGLVPLG